MEISAARPGYELWHPNRATDNARTARIAVIALLLVSAAISFLIIIGGWSKLEGGKTLALAYVITYAVVAWRVWGWSRGVLPVTAAIATILAIFCAMAAPGWFARTRDGLSSPLLPEEMLGLLTVALIPIQIVLVVLATIAFNQDWNVEEERPIGEGPPE